MDPTAFDTLSRAFVMAATRRRLVILLAALPLGGALTTLSDDEVAAEHPHKRLGRRTKQRNRKQRNQNQNNNGGGDGGGNGSGDRLGERDDTCGGCPQGQVCCGTGLEAHCCPTDSHYCWGTDADAACLECPNGSCHVANSAV